MPIDFRDAANRLSYASRRADESWKSAIRSLIDASGLRIADIGCGGGIYARAWLELGAADVIGVDSSPVMVEAAREQNRAVTGLSFTIGDAAATRLPRQSVDVVFARALIICRTCGRSCVRRSGSWCRVDGSLYRIEHWRTSGYRDRQNTYGDTFSRDFHDCWLLSRLVDGRIKP
jgi:2-polyprenyl-3-methyl-5-hydroxy-6-metoxy-1,4-benzoquinol methylase